MTVFVEVIGRGPNLTLLHGWGLNSAVWNAVRDALAKRYTLHIIDLPGHGHSPGAAVTTLRGMANAIASAMPKKTHLLGWSLGGQVAMELALRHAERIEKLLLVATTPRFLQHENWQHAVRPAVLADFGHRLTTNYSATIKSFLALQVLNQPNQRAAISLLEKAITSRGRVDTTALSAGLALLANNDLRDELAHISQATLVLQGDHDALTPEPAGRWLAGQLPRARYVMMDHAAHAPFLSHRDAFLVELDRFLSP